MRRRSLKLFLYCMLSFSKRVFFFFSSRRRHTRYIGDWSSTCALPIFIRGEDLPNPMGTGVDNTRVEGQLPHVAPVHVHNEDLFVSRAVTLEGNLTGVGRPDGAIIIEAVIGGELRNAAPICVHDIDILAGAAAVAIENDARAIGRPTSAGVVVGGVVRELGNEASVQGRRVE